MARYMASFAERRARRAQSSSPHTSRWRWMLLLAATMTLLVVGGVVALLAHQAASTGGAAPITEAALPADRFVQSVVTDDGKLGWEQLCPDIQAALPPDQLVQQADAARAAAAKQGLRLSSQFVRSQSMQAGGETRLYVITAHWSNGTIQQRSFAVETQESGCVEDAGYQ